MGSLRQFKALTWYYLLQKRRNWKTSIWEILLPVIFGIVLGVLSKLLIDQFNDDVKAGTAELSDLINIYTSLYFDYIIFLTVIFSTGCVAILGSMVADKEIRMLETLKIMSMNKAPYAFHFYIGQGIATVISSALVAMFLTIFLKDLNPAPEGFFVIWASLMLLGLGLNSLAMMMSSFFSDYKLSTQIGPLLLFLPSSIVIYCVAKKVGANIQYGYFVPQFPFAVTLLHWFVPDNYPIVNPSTGETIATVDFTEFIIPNAPVGWAWAAQVFIVIGYFLLYLYLDEVIPNNYGVSKSCCFCFRRNREVADIDRETNAMLLEDQARESTVPGRKSTSDPIQINELTKKFGKFTAVNKLSLSVKRNEVFALLGHNGAGKTTAISMLTGMLKATKGDAIIYGHSLSQELDAVRKSLGLCQQFDVLYEKLTIREHLEMVCELKDVPKGEIQQEVNDILALVMLNEHQNKFSTQLSGGMKRKLSLGMSLIGKSQVIILDEPTSGLDVESRRQVWDLIKQIKETRSIIMSTQHLEEADELADRVCIMSQGRIVTLDTPFGIKKQFGVGYNLYLEPKDPNVSKEVLEDIKQRIEPILFDEAIIKGVEESQDSVLSKLIYILPFDQSANFSSLFEKIENQFSELYINVEMTTLEDAYVNIAKKEIEVHDQLANDDESVSEDKKRSTIINDDNENPDSQLQQDLERYMAIEGDQSFFQQLWASYLRRLIIFANEVRQWFLVTAPFVNVVTVVLVIIGFVEANYQGDNASELINLIIDFLFPLLLLYGFAACSAVYTLMPVSERETKMRSLLHMIGIKPICYYTGMFFADYTLYIIPTALFIIFVVASDLTGFADHVGQFAMLLASFGVVLINFTYFFGHFFKDTKSSFKCLTLIYICLGEIIPGLFMGLSTLTDASWLLPTLGTLFFFLDPFYTFYLGVYNMARATLDLGDRPQLFPIISADSHLQGTPATCSLVLLIQGIIFFGISVALDYRYCDSFRTPDMKEPTMNVPTMPPNEDVLKHEEEILADSNHDQFAMKASGIKKTYARGNPAVQGNTFGVRKGQILGLLGPNGAGKSTTFGIMSLDHKRSFGDVHLKGTNIQDIDLSVDGRRMGMCPQYNAIWPQLTVDQSLDFVGRLKGLNKDDIDFSKRLVKQTLDLEPFSNTKSGNLSGGNKRKLSCAQTLMLKPDLEFLDEPTTGVDPVSRRSLLKMVKQLRDSSVLLTTHRMDEAEQLCDHIAIMINGRFVCYGTPGYLKEQYGQGYRFTLKQTKEQSVSVGEMLDQIVLEELPFLKKLTSVETEAGRFMEHSYQLVDQEGFALSKVFGTLNELISSDKIKDFEVTRTTLEQVFIHFAKFQIRGAAENAPPNLEDINDQFRTQAAQRRSTATRQSEKFTKE